MAMEKPVIFTKLGPGPEVITEGETGWLCNPHEPKDIANAIVEVLSNPEKAQAIAKQAKRFVSEKFALHEIAQNNIDFYKKILLF